MDQKIDNIAKLRKVANYKILKVLKEIIDHNPYLRFQQILLNYNITEPKEDKFYEESYVTLRKLIDEMDSKIDS